MPKTAALAVLALCLVAATAGAGPAALWTTLPVQLAPDLEARLRKPGLNSVHIAAALVDVACAFIGTEAVRAWLGAARVALRDPRAFRCEEPNSFREWRRLFSARILQDLSGESAKSGEWRGIPRSRPFSRGLMTRERLRQRAAEVRVGPDTEETFDEEFWTGLDLVPSSATLCTRNY